MRALVISPDSPTGLTFAEANEPQPLANEALVCVHATSLNRGELRLLTIRPEGWIPGQDVVGVIKRAAADGSGPAVGARVVALVDEAGWAEQVAVPTDRLAVIPDEVSFGSAATLPVAGTTALRVLRHGGDLAGQQVLITGASGAVGRFQIQIAREQGAAVIAIAAARHAEDLRGLGAHEVVESIELAEGPFSLITESVGGQSLPMPSTASPPAAPSSCSVRAAANSRRLASDSSFRAMRERGFRLTTHPVQPLARTSPRCSLWSRLAGWKPVCP